MNTNTHDPRHATGAPARTAEPSKPLPATTDKPKIYVYPVWTAGDVDQPADPTRGIETYGGDVSGAAVAEDGTYLAGHLSSSMGWFRHDMGLASNWKHDKYAAHYPDGYELVEAEPPDDVMAKNSAKDPAEAQS